MNRIPTCPCPLPQDIGDLIREIGHLWANGAVCPRIASPTKSAWDALLMEWVNDPSLPLLIRKSSEVRGSVIIHESGRRLIPVDNSPSQWSCSLALGSHVPSRSEIQELFAKDAIPISFAHKKHEKAQRTYHCTLGKYSVNKAGWKLCHINPVGLNTAAPIRCIDVKQLKAAFINLLSPTNYFLLPLDWGGMGETPEFIQGYRNMPAPPVDSTGYAATYKHSRLCFRADVIEPLGMDGQFRIETTRDGTFVMSKRQFYETFTNVVESESYSQNGVYHYPRLPKKALPFRIISEINT
jgi:hypothetical protein